jgi:GTPase SAR1 family protein
LPVEYSFQNLLGKKVLITGDVGAGKTKLTLELLGEAVEMGFRDGITVIDMAPATTVVGESKVGGRLSELTEAVREVRYLAPQRVETPRLKADSADELLYLVGLNEERIRRLIEEFISDPSPILFINDVSIYFQSGSGDPIFAASEAAETLIANGYYGEYFAFDHGTGVSKLEKELMDRLAHHMDVLIRI